jgi:hypothetical protein
MLLSVSCFAQLTDSIYLYRQSENKIGRVYRNATHLLGTSVTKLGVAGIRLDYFDGHFRKAQEAETQTSGTIATKGVTEFGRFKASGYFDFSRIYQDSLAWTTKGTEIDAQPYYFGSIKAGKYERSSYELGGILSYGLIPEKLFISNGIEYSYRSSTRSVDPRPAVNNFKLILKPELTYQLANQFIGLQGKWGYGREDFALGYKNRDYSNGGYPDRVNYMIYGYGLIQISAGTERNRRDERHKGLALNYSGTFNKVDLKASAGYQTWHDENAYVTENSIKNNLIGTFDMDIWRADILLSSTGTKHEQQVSLQAGFLSGEDRRVLYDAVNYRYDQQILNIEYLFHLNHVRRFSTEYGGFVNYEKLEKEDYISAHYVNTNVIEPGLSGTVYLKTTKNNLFSFTAKASYRVPLKNELNVPGFQENVFSRGVVYPDYAYATSRAVPFFGKIQYISNNLFKQFRSGISIGAVCVSKLEDGIVQASTAYTPGNQRLSANLSLNLYF